jgi:putative FmdB family regulatory protein
VATIGAVPLYEFECGRCGARFEELVGAGTDEAECRSCGAVGARRVYSPPAPEPRLVKSGGGVRKQEARNAELRARTKREFTDARRRAGAPGGGLQ